MAIYYLQGFGSEIHTQTLSIQKYLKSSFEIRLFLCLPAEYFDIID